MATLTTKYSVGDTVYGAGTVVVQKQHPCPDCKGERKWTAKSPAGREYEFACPRCSASYQSERDLSLTYSTHAPSVQKLTIGSVRVDTHVRDGDEPVSYMCIETGVGSGSIHRESNLFPTEEKAKSAAESMALARDKSVEWIGKLYNKTLSLSDYQLEAAALKAARDMSISRRTDIQILFDDLRNAEDIDHVRQIMDDFSFRDA